MNREEMITELRQRIESMSDNEILKFHKQTKPETSESIAEDIKKHSKNLRYG